MRSSASAKVFVVREAIEPFQVRTPRANVTDTRGAEDYLIVSTLWPLRDPPFTRADASWP